MPSTEGWTAYRTFTNFKIEAFAPQNGLWIVKRLIYDQIYTDWDGSVLAPQTYTRSAPTDARYDIYPNSLSLESEVDPCEYTTADVPQGKTVPGYFSADLSNVQAEFEFIGWRITTAVSPAGTGSVTGGGAVAKNASVTLEAHPNPGYRFVEWRKNSSQTPESTANPYTFTASSNATYTAVFERAYTITVQAAQQSGTYYGTVSIGSSAHSQTYSESFPPNTSVTLYAYPNPGYDFDHWETNGSTISGAGQEYQITVGNTNATYTAFFRESGVRYQITASTAGFTEGALVWIDSGTPGSSVTSDWLPKGTQFTLHASSTSSGGYYHFAYWIYEDPETQQSEIVSTQIDFTTTADFGHSSAGDYFAIFIAVYGDWLNPIITEVSPLGSGHIEMSPPSPYNDGWYEDGTEVTLTASPAAGFVFSHWSYRDWSGEHHKTDDISFTLTVSGQSSYTTYIAYFVAAYTITTDVSPAGAGNITGLDNPYSSGDTCTLTADANPGYTFSHWTDSSGAIVSQQPQYSFTVTQDETLTAHFDEESESSSSEESPEESSSSEDSSSSEEWEEGPLVYDPATGLLRYDPESGNLRYLRRQVRP